MPNADSIVNPSELDGTGSLSRAGLECMSKSSETSRIPDLESAGRRVTFRPGALRTPPAAAAVQAVLRGVPAVASGKAGCTGKGETSRYSLGVSSSPRPRV